MIILQICHILTTGHFLTWLECLKEICLKNTRNICRKVWARINSTPQLEINEACIVKWKTKSDLNLIKTRVAVTKMRISCHLLPIESGRYKKIPRVERLCPLCNRSEIGDEFHYLLKCTHSSLSHIRGIFLESLYSINSNFTNMSCKALFLYIMSMCDENIINLSASYIENILNCYASEL